MSKFMRMFKSKHKPENNKENERYDTFSEDDRRTVHFSEYTDEEMINPYHAPAQPRKYPKGPQSCPGGVQDNNRKESKRARGHPSQNYFDELPPRGGGSSHHKQRAVNKYNDDESESQRHRMERKIDNLKHENSALHDRCQRLEEELERVRKTNVRYRNERNEYRERCRSQRYMNSYMGSCCQPHFAPAPSNHYFTGYPTVPSVPSVFNDTPSTSSRNSMMRGSITNHGSSYLYPRESLSDLEMNHIKGLAAHHTLSHNESDDDENFLQPLKLSRRPSELSGEEAGFSSAPTLTISDQKHKRPQ